MRLGGVDKADDGSYGIESYDSIVKEVEVEMKDEEERNWEPKKP